MGHPKQQELSFNENLWRNRQMYENEGLPIIIKWPKNEVKGTTSTLTPEGISLLLNPKLCKLPKPGTAVTISIELSKEQGPRELKGVVIDISDNPESNTTVIVNITLLRDIKKKSRGKCSREHKRYSFSEDMRPVAHCEDPLFFQEYIYLQMVDVGRNGAGFTLTGENKGLIEGQVLNLQVYFPLIGMTSLSTTIENIIPIGDSFYRIGTKFRKTNDKTLKTIAEFLLLSQESLSLEQLRAQGYPIASLRYGITFRYARSIAEIQEVLKLRLTVSRHNKDWLSRGAEPNDMLDYYDRFSRQICLILGEKVIGAARIVFNDGLPDRCEHAKFDFCLPDWLWDKGFVEASRLCIDPEFQGSDIILHLISQIGRITIQSGQRYILLSCKTKLLHQYKRIGCKPLGITYTSKFNPNIKLHLLYADVYNITTGIQFNPIRWQRFSRRFVSYIWPRLNIFQKAILFFNSLIGPYADKLYRKYFYDKEKEKLKEKEKELQQKQKKETK